MQFMRMFMVTAPGYKETKKNIYENKAIHVICVVSTVPPKNVVDLLIDFSPMLMKTE